MAWQGKRIGTAWEQHGMCELDLKVNKILSGGRIIECWKHNRSRKWEVRGQVEECHLRGNGHLVLEENLHLPFMQVTDNRRL
jgi:hypothetical protein